MADKKITALTALTATTKDSSVDLLHIIDYSAAPVNKKISVADLFDQVNTNTHIYGASKTFELGTTSTTFSALKVTTGSLVDMSANTATTAQHHNVIVNDDANRHVDFTVKSAQSAQAIFVDSDFTSGNAGPGTVFINGDAGNQDFMVQGDNYDTSANDPVLFSDASYNAAGLGTSTLDGNYCVQVAAGPNAGVDKHSAQFQGNIALSGVEDLVGSAVSGNAATLSAFKSVHKLNIDDGDTVTLTLPTTGCVDGQIKIIYCDTDSAGGTFAIATTNRHGAEDMGVTAANTGIQDIGDCWIGMYESGTSKWITLNYRNGTTT
jgi:hypothetical protein